jgi:hypothetical protein
MATLDVMGRDVGGHGWVLLWWEAGGDCGEVVYWGLPFTYRTLMLSTYRVGTLSADKSERPGKGP